MGLRMKMSFTYVNNIFLTTIREMRYCTNKISSQDEVDMIQTYAGDLDILYDDLSTNDRVTGLFKSQWVYQLHRVWWRHRVYAAMDPEGVWHSTGTDYW